MVYRLPEDGPGLPTGPGPGGPGDEGNRQTDGSFWEVVTTTMLDPETGLPSSNTTVTIVYEDDIIISNAEGIGDNTAYAEAGGVYTRGNQIASGTEGLGQWVQYSVSFQATTGGNSGKSWVVGTYPPRITVTWDGQQVWNQEYPNGEAVVGNIIEITPTGSDLTYYRGIETGDPLGLNLSTFSYYDVNIGPSSPPQPGEIGVPSATPQDYGLEVLNADGNQIWGSNNRVISFVNAVRTGTIPIPAGQPQTVIVDVDLTEFGWTLTNTSEVGVYVRQTYPVVRTSTGFRLTWFNTYGINFTTNSELPFQYYVMRF